MVMTLIRTHSVASLPVPATARGSFARVEKISLSNKLDGEREDNSAQESFAAAKLARTQPSRNETANAGAQENALRYVPTFVTQVLAQITESAAPDAASAILAYGHRRAQIAFVCDRDA